MIFAPLKIIPLLFLTTLKIFSLSLTFLILTMICKGVVSFYLCYLRFTEVLGSVGFVLYQYGEILCHYLFKIVLPHFFSDLLLGLKLNVYLTTWYCPTCLTCYVLTLLSLWALVGIVFFHQVTKIYLCLTSVLLSLLNEFYVYNIIFNIFI